MIRKKCQSFVANVHASMLIVHKIPPAARNGYAASYVSEKAQASRNEVSLPCTHCKYIIMRSTL